MQENIKNFTPHPFTFFSIEDCTYDTKSRKFILQTDENGALPHPLFFVQPEPMPLRGTTSEVEHGNFSGIPQVAITLNSCDPIPQLAEGQIAIVSLMYMTAAKLAGLDVSKLRTVIPCYKTADGQNFGVVKLAMP